MYNKGNTKFKLPKAMKKLLNHFESQAALGRALGQKPSTVSGWFKRGEIPMRYIFKIEKMTNKTILAKELRPDLF